MKILNRKSSIEGDNIIVVENVEKTYTYSSLLSEMQNIKIQKLHYIEQSKKLKEEYDNLSLKEAEIEEMLSQIKNSNHFKEIID